VFQTKEPLRWRVTALLTAAIAISYLDRQTLPWAIAAIQRDIPISNQVKAFLDSAFLVTYGLMYLGGGRFVDAQGTRRGFLVIMLFWSLACASHGLAGGYGMPALLGLPFAVVMLAASRLLLGVGEGGGFPTATRAVAEWFPAHERSTAMGIVNAGTAVGAVVGAAGATILGYYCSGRVDEHNDAVVDASGRLGDEIGDGVADVVAW
jgi:ACS family hexuronate transporter-like MFS transporter